MKHISTRQVSTKRSLTFLVALFIGILAALINFALVSAVTDTVPVYRFYNAFSGSHIYTTDTNEKNHLQKFPNVYKYEKVAYYANSTAVTDTVPVYRFYNAFSGSHIYTTDTNEKNHLQKFPNVYKYEKVAYYANSTAVTDTVPVYRFYNAFSGSHIYTTDTNEKNHLQKFPNVYKYEKVAYYANFGPSSEKAITGFTIASQVGGTVIDEASHTISITMPSGTNPNGLTPIITDTGITVNPGSGIIQDFTNPVVYTVTAQDGSTQDYAVTVTVLNDPPSAPTIISSVYQTGPSVLIRVTPSTDSDGSVVSHSLFRDGALISTTTSNSNPILIYDNTVSSSTTYDYTVVATDDDSDDSASSNASSITIPDDVTPPSAPNNFSIDTPYDSDACTITLSWDPSTDNTVAQEDLWYIITSPLDESYFYTWTQNNPYNLTFCWDTGDNEVYIQATDGNNNSTKVGPLIITAP